ncbi:MAG: branched-chain amino acid ABC transporter permease [Spirochaetia bacterium]|jgi:branched-chain amino acid transport system permease protein
MTGKRAAILWTAAGVAAAAAILLWKPTALVYGVQRAGLYAAVAIPMALVLGIVHIVNLAHGELMMVSAYLAYFAANRLLGLDPFAAMIPVAIVMALVGFLIYKLTIKHALKAPELNQLILTFGLAIAFSQTANLLFTSQSFKLSLGYVSASATIGETSFGVFDFVFVALAILLAAGLRVFLTRTRMGKAALAVGQNPRGAAIVGIDVDRTYAIVFALAVGLIGLVGSLFLTKQAIFPGVGGPYTMKSFCLVAMAGVGNIVGILFCSLALGLSESVINGIRGYAGWSNIVFFAIIIATILIRSYRERKT